MMVMMSVLESGADRVTRGDVHRDHRAADRAGQRGLVERLLGVDEIGLGRVDGGLVRRDLLGGVGVCAGRAVPPVAPAPVGLVPVEPVPVAGCVDAGARPVLPVPLTAWAAGAAGWGRRAARCRRRCCRCPARGLGVEGLAERGLVLGHGGLILRHLLLVRGDRLERGLARGLAGRGARVGAGAVALGLGQVGRLLVLVGRRSTGRRSAWSGRR